MSKTPQTEAQRLADWADDRAFSDAAYCNSEYNAIAAELRRLDALVAGLEAVYKEAMDSLKLTLSENDQLRAQLAKAVAEEREACAKVCDDRYMGDNNREDMEAKRCAAAIRARSNT